MKGARTMEFWGRLGHKMMGLKRKGKSEVINIVSKLSKSNDVSCFLQSF